jgi:hypothetical protein
MSASSPAAVYPYARPKASLPEESASEPRAAFWRINGFRARLLIWTLSEWETLDARPPDAQYHPSGVWCALRLD